MKKLLVLCMAAACSACSFAVVVLDTATGASTTFTGSTPRNLIGFAFNLGNTSGPTSVRGLDFAYTSATAATYQNIRIEFTFFDASTNATTGANPVFSSPLATYGFNTGPVTTAANTSYIYQGSPAGTNPGITFTPFTFNNTSNLGVQFWIRSDSGNGLENNQNLTFRLRRNVAFAVGSGTNNGFYRNASNANPTSSATSLIGSDFRTLTSSTDVGVWMRLHAVPEPATLIALGCGAVALVARRRRRK